MAKFLGVKLSENMQETPEGYLICLNAIIARTGFQIYKGHELDQEELAELNLTFDRNADVKVLRLAEDVFNKDTVKSFEGKDFTLTHPSKLISLDHECDVDIVGHVQNVRQGKEILEDGNWPLLADIIVKDKVAINAIKDQGVRQLSCGYNYHLKMLGDNLCQTDILGNHVALVERGRAGPGAAIQDAEPIPETKFKGFKMSTITARLLKAIGLQQIAATSTPEEFAVAFDKAMEDEKPEAKDACSCEGKGSCSYCKGKEAKDSKVDDSDVEQLAGLLAGGAGALKSKSTPGLDKEEEEEGEEANDEEAEDEEADDEEGEEAKDEAVETNPSPEIPTDARFKTYVASATDAAYRKGMKDTLVALKPIVAKSGNPKAVSAFDAIMKQVTSKPTSKGSYSAVANASAKRSKEAMDSMTANQAEKKRMEEINSEYAKYRGVNSVKK